MPPTKRQTPQEFFGYAPLELFQKFKPALPPDDPRWSIPHRVDYNDYEAFEDELATQRDERIGREKQRFADADVDEMLIQAQETPDSSAIMRMVAQNPQVLRSRDFPMLNDYIGLRQEMERPMPYSAQVLGPQMMQKLKHPQSRTNFQQNLGQMDINEAFNMALRDDDNFDAELEAAEYGLGPEDRRKFWNDQTNMYDRAAIRAHGANAKRGNPLEREIEFRERRLTALGRRLEGEGKFPDDDPTYRAQADELDAALSLYRQGLTTSPPVETPAPPSAVEVIPETAPVAAPPAPLALPKPPHQRAAEEQQAVKQNQAKRAVDNAWQQAKVDLADKLTKKFDIEDIIGHFGGLVSGARAPESSDDFVDGFGRTQAEDYAYYLMRQLGIPPEDVAFEEPGNLRGGSNKVRYTELLRALAQDVLRDLGYDVDPKPKRQPPANAPLPKVKSEGGKEIQSEIISGKA